MSLPKSAFVAITKTDYPRWAELFASYIRFYNSSIPEAQYPRTFARILDPASELHGMGLKEPESGELIGIAHYFPHQNPWSESKIMLLNDLFIDPAVRSKGYGKAMIEAVAEHAKELGCSRLQWVTKHDNPARKMYDKVGTSDFVQYRMAFS